MVGKMESARKPVTLKRCETVKVRVHCKYDMVLRYIAEKVMKREDGRLGTIPYYMVVLPLFMHFGNGWKWGVDS